MPIRKRPVQFTRNSDVNARNTEKNFQHIDSALTDLDNRRIAQQDSLSDSATTTEIINAINTLNGALNASELTED